MDGEIEGSRENVSGILSEWVRSHEGERAITAEIERRWEAYEGRGLDFDCRGALSRLDRRIDAGKRRNARRGKRISGPVRWMCRIAAAAVIFAAGMLAFEYTHKAALPAPGHPLQTEIYNPKGLRTTVTLPDSSRVVLNADSRLSYSGQLAGDTRTVRLTGEALFDVAKDARRPFIVETGQARMTVLGTVFNVRSYPGDKCMETTLLEGALKIDAGSTENVLTPGRQMILNRTSQQSRFREVDTRQAIGWTEGKLYFRSTPFDEAAAELSRTFGTNIELRDEALRDKIFNGKFEKGESLEQILHIMQSSVRFTVRYDKETNTFEIR